MATRIHMRHETTLRFAADAKMPNSDLPVVIYQKAGEGEDLESAFRRAFKANHWGGLWVNGVFGYHHFHSNAHEVLAIVAGTADLQLGGESGQAITVAMGDVLILPAGTGHRRLRASADFSVLGGYPEGQEGYDMYTDVTDCANCRARLAAVARPEADPIYGADGPLMRLWSAE